MKVMEDSKLITPNICCGRKIVRKRDLQKILLPNGFSFIEEVRELESTVIFWEHRKTNDQGGNALASVDTTDVKF